MDRRSTNQQAFTLIELIISMTIIAVILVIVFGAFRISIRAWEKGEKDIDKQQRFRIVMDLIHRQMISISFKKIPVEDKQVIVLKGDSKSFGFLSNIALKPDNKFGIVYIQYRVDNDEAGNYRLYAYEKNLVLFGNEFNPDEIDQDAFFELIPSAQLISFEFLKPPEEGLEEKPQWQDSWDPETDQGVPLAARMTVIDQPGNTPLVIITPFYDLEESS